MCRRSRHEGWHGGRAETDTLDYTQRRALLEDKKIKETMEVYETVLIRHFQLSFHDALLIPQGHG